MSLQSTCAKITTTLPSTMVTVDSSGNAKLRVPGIPIGTEESLRDETALRRKIANVLYALADRAMADGDEKKMREIQAARRVAMRTMEEA